MNAAEQMTRHYLHLAQVSQFELMSGEIDCEQFEATLNASAVACHYLSEHTRYSEFSAALKQADAVKEVVRATMKLAR